MAEKVYNFNASLKKSQSDQDLTFWKTLYVDWFGEGITIIKHPEHGVHQKEGIDRSIVLPNSRQFLIEEKVDWYETGNMFLEYWSSYDDRSPGWIEKPLRCDYLVYAFPKCGQAFLFDFLQLRKTWFANKNEFIRKYGEKRVYNDKGRCKWTTVGVAVPVRDIYAFYHQNHCIRFKKISDN